MFHCLNGLPVPTHRPFELQTRVNLLVPFGTRTGRHTSKNYFFSHKIAVYVLFISVLCALTTSQYTFSSDMIAIGVPLVDSSSSPGIKQERHAFSAGGGCDTSIMR